MKVFLLLKVTTCGTLVSNVLAKVWHYEITRTNKQTKLQNIIYLFVSSNK